MSQFDAYSRFRNTQSVLYNGSVTVGTWVPPSYITTRPDESQISTFIVPHGMEGRPDLIANQLYNTPYLDWVLIMFNTPNEVFGWPKVGDAIEYPDESLVMLNL